MRCAAELERQYFEALPDIDVDWPALELALSNKIRVSPSLASTKVRVIPPLRLRGRVRGDEIWIGAPGTDGPSVSHVAWQAAHEATVAELALHASRPERTTERMAVALLAARARRVDQGAEHAEWLAHFAAPPSVDIDTLEPEEARVVRERSNARQ